MKLNTHLLSIPQDIQNLIETDFPAFIILFNKKYCDGGDGVKIETPQTIAITRATEGSISQKIVSKNDFITSATMIIHATLNQKNAENYISDGRS